MSIKPGAKSEKASAQEARQQLTQELPPAVKSTFQDIFKLVDDRHYKRAVKTADAVLKKVPGHAPSMAMKALCLYNMGKKEEGHDLAKAALKADLKNFVCWHVFGSLHKADGNLPEALKSYRNALKFQPENLNTMRDLALIQLMLRDYRGHHETRRQMVINNPKMPANWIGFAVAHYLAGNFDMALAVLDQYESTLEPAAMRQPAYETSELNLFRIKVCEAANKPLKALELMMQPSFALHVVDQLQYREKLASLLLQVGQRQQASNMFMDLIAINSEHYGYHRGLQACVLSSADANSLLALTGCALPSNTPSVLSTLSSAQVESLFALYVLLALKYPRSRTIKRIPLDLLPSSHDAFRPLLNAYLVNGLRKGLPSLFSDVKTLYRSAEQRGLAWPARQAIAATTASDTNNNNGGGGGNGRSKAAVIGSLLESYDASVSSGKAIMAAEVSSDSLSALVKRLTDSAAANDVLAKSPLMTTTAGAGAATSAITAEALTGLWKVDAPAPPAEGSPESAKAVVGEEPSIVPWLRLFAARHHDELGATDKALASVDAAITHTPTIQDLYLVKARLLKHRGELSAAADAADKGRSLDLADRYLNIKATQYLLRAGRVDQAHRTLALFTRSDAKESTGDPLGNVDSLEILWYHLEAAASYERYANYGLALKHYLKVDSIFKTFAEDQNDFHLYCLRKGPLKAYTAVLAMTDFVRKHSDFLKAMAGAVRCYLALHEEKEKGLVPAGTLASEKWQQTAVAERVAAACSAKASGGNQYVSSFLAIAQGQVENAKAAAASITAAKEAKAAEKLKKSGVKPDAAAAAAAAAAADDDKDDDNDDDDEGKDTKDLLGDKLAKGGSSASPLDEAQKYVAILLQNLPPPQESNSTEASVVSTSVADAAVSKMPTPLAPRELVAANPRSVENAVFRTWNTPPGFIAEAHLLATKVSLLRGKLLPAVASMHAAQRAAKRSAFALWASSCPAFAPSSLGLQHLHPASLEASLRVYKAIEAELASPSSSSSSSSAASAGAGAPGGEGGASAEADTSLTRVHDSLRAILAKPEHLGGKSVEAFISGAVASSKAVSSVLELSMAVASATGGNGSSKRPSPLFCYERDAGAYGVYRAAASLALGGGASVESLQAAAALVKACPALATSDAAGAAADSKPALVILDDVFGLGIQIVGEKEKEKEKEKEGAKA